MKILQICNKPPFPPSDGGCIAMKNIAEGLVSKGCELDMFCLSTTKHPFVLHAFPASLRQKSSIQHASADTSIKLFPALYNLLNGTPYNVSRFFSQNAAEKLKQCIEGKSYDIIQLESIYTTPYLKLLRLLSSAKIVLRAHNIESKLMFARSKGQYQYIKKYYLRILSKQLNDYEKTMVSDLDAVAAISPVDRDYFASVNPGIPVCDIPAGMEETPYRFFRKTNHSGTIQRIFHIGALDWEPNVHGIKWFVKFVWPKLHAKHPELQFHIAGRNPSKKLTFDGKNIIYHGEIENALRFMQQNDILVVPLFESSGIRIKILEAMSVGNPVVSTSDGAKGLKVHNKTHLLIADDPDDFFQSVSCLVCNADMRRRLIRHASELVHKEYGADSVTEKLLLLYEQLTGK